MTDPSERDRETAHELWRDLGYGASVLELSVNERIDIIATALADERARAIEAMRHEIVSLCEDTEASYATVTDETEGKFGAYARGRIKEAKSIRNAMCEVARALADSPATTEPDREG